MAIRNPEAGGIIRAMRKDLSQDITKFITEHAPELDLDYKSSSGLSSGVELGPSITHICLRDSEDEEDVNPPSGKQKQWSFCKIKS